MTVPPLCLPLYSAPKTYPIRRSFQHPCTNDRKLDFLRTSNPRTSHNADSPTYNTSRCESQPGYTPEPNELSQLTRIQSPMSYGSARPIPTAPRTTPPPSPNPTPTTTRRKPTLTRATMATPGQECPTGRPRARAFPRCNSRNAPCARASIISRRSGTHGSNRQGVPRPCSE